MWTFRKVGGKKIIDERFCTHMNPSVTLQQALCKLMHCILYLWHYSSCLSCGVPPSPSRMASCQLVSSLNLRLTKKFLIKTLGYHKLSHRLSDLKFPSLFGFSARFTFYLEENFHPWMNELLSFRLEVYTLIRKVPVVLCLMLGPSATPALSF